jgi:DnaJ-class molecular chaperone
MSETLYNILEVPETASQEEIKKSYRRLSMLYHPDKNSNNPNATINFQKISSAYEILGDPEERKKYDASLSNPFLRNGRSHEDLLSKLFTKRGPQVNPIDQMFASFFGMPFGEDQEQGQGPTMRVFQNGREVPLPHFHMPTQKPVPIIKTITIPIDKILTGTTLPVEIQRWISTNNTKTFETETIYIHIPKGIDEGEIIVLRDKGNIINETNKGDIKLSIKIVNDTEFKRNGLDLILEKQITLKEALCGFSFDLRYITGKTYTINNHSGNIINHGYKKIIPGMGLEREEHVGNLVIIFSVRFPEKLSEEVIEQLKQLSF